MSNQNIDYSDALVDIKLMLNAANFPYESARLFVDKREVNPILIIGLACDQQVSYNLLLNLSQILGTTLIDFTPYRAANQISDYTWSSGESAELRVRDCNLFAGSSPHKP